MLTATSLRTKYTNFLSGAWVTFNGDAKAREAAAAPQPVFEHAATGAVLRATAVPAAGEVDAGAKGLSPPHAMHRVKRVISAEKSALPAAGEVDHCPHT